MTPLWLLVALAFATLASNGCAQHHDSSGAEDGGASDTGGHEADGSSPRLSDGGTADPTPAPCLGVASDDGAGSLAYGLMTAPGPYDRFDWLGVLDDGPRSLVIVMTLSRGVVRSFCLAALGEDLSVEWSRWLPSSDHRPLLTVIAGHPYLVHVERGRVVRREVDRVTGTLGPEATSDGWDDLGEWVRIAGAADGGFLVAWNLAWTIEARAFGPDGRALGAAVRLSDNGRYPYVTSDGDRWLVGYHELRDGAVTGPVALVLDRSGNPISAPVYPDGPAYGGGTLQIERTPAGLAAAWGARDGIHHAVLTDMLEPIDAPATLHTTTGERGARVVRMVNPARGSAIAFGHSSDGTGGWIFVPSGDPSAFTIVGVSDWPRPNIALTAGRVIALDGGETLRATALSLP